MNNPYHEIEVLWLAETEYNAGSSLKEHSHSEYYQIYYVTESSGIFTVNGQEYELSKDMFVLACPGTSHGIQSASGTNLSPLRIIEVKFIVFNHELAHELRQLSAVSFGNPQLRDKLYSIYKDGMGKDLFFVRIVEHGMCALLYKMIQFIRNEGVYQGGAGGSVDAVTHIKEYIDAHYTEDITLDELAQIIGYSKNYLCRLFREQTGDTINTYLNNVRINAAANLLVETKLDVAEISEMVGYNNVFHFIKTFKKFIGVPPGNYRKNELTGETLASESVFAESVILRAGTVIPRTR